MSTIEIDPEKFLNAIAFALQECAKRDQDVVGIVTGPLKPVKGKGPFGQAGVEPSSTIEKSTKNEFVGETPKKKRGRPKKEIIEVGDLKETVEEVINYVAPSRNEYTFAAKPINHRIAQNTNMDGLPCRTEDIYLKDRKVKFFDDRAVAKDKIKYPEPIPTDRNPAKKVKFVCDSCRNEFEAYWSEYPQALIKWKNPELGIHSNERTLVKCNDCAGRPSI